MDSPLKFKVLVEDGRCQARVGSLTLHHGVVETPVFMPVGTFATVKTLEAQDLLDLDVPMILGNTYHLMLRPGAEVFRKLGGLHGFQKWPRPILTDSGGYQVFCLSQNRTIREEGAIFQSYVNGDKVLLSPETSIEMQQALGSDVMMVLDECIPSTAPRSEAVRAMNLTHRWALRSWEARQRHEWSSRTQSLFAIVQGATDLELRKQSADFLTQHPFDGFAVGGLAVGEGKTLREDVTEYTAQLLPKEKPRYLMGVGTPIDLIEGVRRGIDMFDCILPTKMAQQGIAFTWRGKVAVGRTAYRMSDEPLDPLCGCLTCRTHSMGYLQHLMKCQEPLGWRLLSRHNIAHYLELMAKLRASLKAGQFEQTVKGLLDQIGVSDTGTVNGSYRPLTQ